MRLINPALKLMAIATFAVALFACTEEKTYVTNITNPTPDVRPPTVEWVDVRVAADSTADLNRRYLHLRDTVTLTVSASDESGIDSVKVYINGFQRFRATPPTPPSIEGGDFAFLWNTLSDSDGVYSLEARAWDKAGNVGETPALLVSVSNTTPPPPADHTPPRIRLISPEPGSVIRNEFELIFIVIDSSHLNSVAIFVDGEVGQILAARDDSLYNAHMNSDRWSNGRKIFEVRAHDAAGNIGSSNPLGLTIDNHQVIWVPDDYEKIQDAINASVDGDTVRVRAGTYHEGLRLMGKNIWLESEQGPEVTLIDGAGNWNDGIWVTDGEEYLKTMIRGFQISGYVNSIRFSNNSSAVIANCIIKGEVNEYDPIGVWCGTGNGYLYNCAIENCFEGIHVDYVQGFMFNTIIINCELGFFKSATLDIWFENGWNLFWNNDEDYRNRDPAETDIFANPGLIQGSYILSQNSPAVDAGKPDIFDLDGGRSDIGVYGGPFSYPPPNR